MKICIITDDRKFHRMLELELSEQGFEIVPDEGLGSCRECLVLCDLDFCEYERLRLLSQSHAICGWSRENTDSIEAASLCVCVLSRPFLISELKLALEKLSSGESAPKKQPAKQQRVSELGRRKNILTCNYEKREAVFGANVISLSPAETEVLKLLCDRRGEVVSREELSALFANPCGNISDVYICKLRTKIDNALGVKFIYTVKGKGYILK